MIEYQIPHCRSIQFQESTQCICYQDCSQTFASLSVSKEGIGSIHLLSDRTFETISSYTLGNDEISVCILNCSFSGDDRAYYCVGTICLRKVDEERDRDKVGRIVV